MTPKFIISEKQHELFRQQMLLQDHGYDSLNKSMDPLMDSRLKSYNGNMLRNPVNKSMDLNQVSATNTMHSMSDNRRIEWQQGRRYSGQAEMLGEPGRPGITRGSQLNKSAERLKGFQQEYNVRARYDTKNRWADGRTSEKSEYSLKSFEFAGDRFLVSQIFQDLDKFTEMKKFEEVSRQLIELVDLLKKMTIKKQDYADFDVQ